jgi:hypothetical protein
MLSLIFCLLFEYSSHDFYYTKDGHFKNVINNPIDSFDKWKKMNFKNTSSEILIPTNTKYVNSTYTVARTSAVENAYNYLRVNCTSKGSSIDSAYCFIYIADEAWSLCKNGVYINHGDSMIYEFDVPIKNESTIIVMHLVNLNEINDAVFNIPTVEYLQLNYVALEPSTTTRVDSHENMFIKKCKVPSSAGQTYLTSMALENSHPLPDVLASPNHNYYPGEEKYSRIPLISNSTHIIAFNIFQEEYIHMWYVTRVEYSYVFQMHMQTRKSGADISYILWELNTTSWLDAVERWHQEFPEIYNIQSAGWGFLAAFPNLNQLFPDSNDETEVFQIAFQWKADLESKPTVPNWAYVEPTLIHVPIPYNKNTIIEDLETCKNNVSLGEDAVRCGVILSSALRFSNGDFYIDEEHQPWNENGTLSGVFFDKEAREFYLNFIETWFNMSIEYNFTVQYSGVALDSFGYGSIKAYAFEDEGYAPGSDFVPYYRVDKDGNPFLPLFAGLFQAVKDWKSISPRGMLLNSDFIMPELVEYAACIGGEIRIGDDIHGYIEYNYYYETLFWSARFTTGSRPMSFLDNSNREVSFSYKEEYFSVMASIGSASSWNTPIGISNIFWNNKSDIDIIRPFIKRWMPALNESFNGNIYFANGLGLISADLPEDRQNPPLNTKHELLTTSLWCRPKETASNGRVDCYLTVFLGYSDSHTVGNNFNREARVTIKDGKNIECFFTAENITCHVEKNNNVTVRIHGIPSRETYRTAIVKFRRKLTKYPDGVDGSEITAGTIIAIVAVVIFVTGGAVFGVWFYLKNNKKEISNSGIDNSLVV